jgi:hypothetical protein
MEDKTMDKMTEKKVYVRPSIEDHGKVADLTATGMTNPTAADMKGGSVGSRGQ